MLNKKLKLSRVFLLLKNQWVLQLLKKINQIIVISTLHITKLVNKQHIVFGLEYHH